MKPLYRIEGQFFDESYEMGVLLQIKQLVTGECLLLSPLEVFNDLDFLGKLSISDVRLVGFIVGDYQMYLSQRYIRTNSEMEEGYLIN